MKIPRLYKMGCLEFKSHMRLKKKFTFQVGWEFLSPKEVPFDEGIEMIAGLTAMSEPNLITKKIVVYINRFFTL